GRGTDLLGTRADVIQTLDDGFLLRAQLIPLTLDVVGQFLRGVLGIEVLATGVDLVAPSHQQVFAVVAVDVDHGGYLLGCGLLRGTRNDGVEVSIGRRRRNGGRDVRGRGVRVLDDLGQTLRVVQHGL